MIDPTMGVWSAPRREATFSSPLAEQLRRAGYVDGERRPRHLTHWLNRGR
jgi:hypothetical protein